MQPITVQIPCHGYEIVADWFGENNPERVLLILPGYTSSRVEHRKSAQRLIEQTGTAVLTIDYSGHGDSPFGLAETRPAQHALEAICAFDWLSKRFPDAAVSVSGSSYGSFLGAYLSAFRKFDNLILRAPAIYEPKALYTLWAERLADEDSYRERIVHYRQDSPALQKHPVLLSAREFAGRTLVAIHGADELIPPATSKAYVAAFSATSFTADNFTHSISHAHVSEAAVAAYWQRIGDWLLAS
jgi:alpha/beta superfamily hydrolase